MIENQFEGCLEHPFKFGAEYHSYCTLCSRPDVERITFEDRYKPVATMNEE
jgi:hypothetical protein